MWNAKIMLCLYQFHVMSCGRNNLKFEKELCYAYTYMHAWMITLWILILFIVLIVDTLEFAIIE